MNKSRTDIVQAIQAIVPIDRLERAQRDQTLSWIDAGAAIYRTDNPEHHLVSYFVPFDTKTQSVLLFYHRKSGLLLPPGGHLERDETFQDAVEREMREELESEPSYFGWLGAQPMFITTTVTNGAVAHLDVSLWHLVVADAGSDIWYDKREFEGYAWCRLEDLAEPQAGYDPHTHRFVRKLSLILQRLEAPII